MECAPDDWGKMFWVETRIALQHENCFEQVSEFFAICTMLTQSWVLQEVHTTRSSSSLYISSSHEDSLVPRFGPSWACQTNSLGGLNFVRGTIQSLRDV